MDALKYAPNNFELYYQMGMAYTMLNDFQNAKLCYQKAASINSALYNAYYKCSTCLSIYICEPFNPHSIL